MTDSHHEPVATSLFRIGALAMLAGIGLMVVRLHEGEVPGGWWTFVGGAVIAVNGATAPIAYYAGVKTGKWRKGGMEVEHDD